MSEEDLNELVVEVLLEIYAAIGKVNNKEDVDRLGRSIVTRVLAMAGGSLDGWRTMGSAPRDGASVLLIARYPHGNGWSDIYQCWWDKFLDDCTGAWSPWPRQNLAPTHWRPLPLPPEREG